jgi:uncharacterized phage-associated protein
MGSDEMLNFDEKKAAEAASVLLRFEGDKMEYLRLLKLLYIADRESIGETGEPISYSRSMAMDYGPLSSEVYDLVKGTREDQAVWSAYIATHAKSVKLVADPGRGMLSKYEIDKLNEVSQRYEGTNTFDLVKITHAMPEWKKNEPEKGSSRLIPLGDIIDAVGMGDHKNEILQDLRQRASVSRFFAGTAR